jgi:flagellar motor component MotA
MMCLIGYFLAGVLVGNFMGFSISYTVFNRIATRVAKSIRGEV